MIADMMLRGGRAAFHHPHQPAAGLAGVIRDGGHADATPGRNLRPRRPG